MIATTLLLVALATATPDEPLEDYEVLLDAAEQQSLGCENFDALFAMTADARMHGTHPGEELAAANEQAFLRCPIEFMRGLNAQPAPTQQRVANHFGLQLEPWVLGAILAKLRANAEIGPLIEREFRSFLESEPDFSR